MLSPKGELKLRAPQHGVIARAQAQAGVYMPLIMALLIWGYFLEYHE
jgi:hypothetical protein